MTVPSRRTLAKAVAGRLAWATGWTRRRLAGGLTVLTFHRVRPDAEDDASASSRPMRNLEVRQADFHALLAWMATRFRPVPLQTELEARAAGAVDSEPRFAVTFDDGWADNHSEAWPVLRALRIPATLFLATGAVEDRQPFWWQAPGWSDTAIEAAKDAPRDEREARWTASAAATAERTARAADFLSWEQVREMAAEGLVQFGLHGHGHELLTADSATAALNDLRKCDDLLRANLPTSARVPILAWPNGNARTDVDAALENMGLLAALGTQRGLIGRLSEAGPGRWNLHRNNVDRQLAASPSLWPWMLVRAASAAD